MIELRLTEEQAGIVRRAPDTVRLCGPDGQLLGLITPVLTDEFVAELKRRARSPGPWYSSEQTDRRLDALEEERKKTGRLDERRMNEILAHFDRIDPGKMRAENGK
ncbi:MAG: hypothetical protein U0793_24840 [Gemmataceae bacterium]